MRTRLIRAFIAGLVGTVAMNLVAYTAYPLALGGVPLDIAAMLGSMLGDDWIAGLIADFTLGTLIVPALYVGLFHLLIPGRPPVRGMLWGLLVGLVAAAVLSPLARSGFFSQLAGGFPVGVGLLIGTVVYGFGFGIVFDGPPHRRSMEKPGAHKNVPIRRAG